jgi:Uncharacterized protein conserved in bacteria
MVCPNCGSNLSDKRTRCDKCGEDLVIYKKILRASNFYYNNGLAKAKVHDLSGAIIALRKSLELNKTHTDARNLLGLTYFAMGETVAALSEWVISKHFQPNHNDADEYINRVQSNPTRLDTLSQAIKRYNSALTYSKQGSDDLAIIQLKKVVTLNPQFIRAYQLLALLHMKGGDNEKAKKFLIKAGKIDVSNTTTLRYMHELESMNSNAKDLDANPEAEQSSYNSSIMPISSYREDKPNIIAYVNLVIGLMVGMALMALLIIPNIKHNATSGDNYKNNTANEALLKDKDNKIKTLTDNNTALQSQIEQLQTQINESVTPADTLATYDALVSANTLYIAELGKSKSSRDFTATADALAAIDDTKLSSEPAKTLLTNLRQAVYPDVAKDVYYKGHSKYNSGKYAEAVELLLKAMKFDPTDANAVYFAARCYDHLDDKTNAALYYNKVITEFPDSNRVTDATNLLKSIQGQ